MKDTSKMIAVKEALKLDIGTGEHLIAEIDDRLLWESSTGEVSLVECLPSNLPVHHRYSRRLEKKFKVSEKKAALAAYMIYEIAGLDKEVCRWFEGICTAEGFDNGFAQAKKWHFELFQCEPKSTDVMGKISKGLPTGSEYYAVPIVTENEKYDPRMPLSDLVREMKDQIRRAGVKQIGQIGKKLYKWSQDETARKVFGFETIKEMWDMYNSTKKRLEAYR